MESTLSEKQKRILNYIKDEIREKGYPPSVREIGDAVGLKSPSTVHGHLARLERKGYIRRDPSKPRALEITDESDEFNNLRRNVVAVPLIGRVAAGQPILAQQNVEDVYPLPRHIAKDDGTFLLLVSGESMMDVGILDGDYVLVRPQCTANNGEIVVARIDDEATVKRFFKEADRFRLQPENATMKPIYTNQVDILGRVIGLIRRMD